MKHEFSQLIFENTQISNLMNICPVGDKLFHADGQIDGRTVMTKLIVAFRSNANAPKKKLCDLL
jgi:hypothetical protein